MMRAMQSAGPAVSNCLRGYWPLGLVALVMVAAAALFLVVHFQGTAPTTTPVPSPAVQQPVLPIPAMESVRWQDLNRSLVRTGIRPEGPLPQLEVLLATPTYFGVTHRSPPEAARRQPSLLFYVIEDAHEQLPPPPRPLLRVDSGRLYGPADTTVLVDSEHHRTILLRYLAVDPQEQPLVTQDTGRVELTFTGPQGGQETSSNVLTWDLPIQYTQAVASREVAVGLPAGAATPEMSMAQGGGHENRPGSPVPSLLGGQTFTWAAILAILAGMLIALSPCLIQLGVYYTATLAAVSTEGTNPGLPTVAAAQRHVVRTGLFFALGFTLVYTAGGAAAGFVGQSLDTLGLFNTWMRPLSVVAGIIIILLALRVAWNARAPLVCRLPMQPLFGSHHRTGVVGSALMGISFAGGCLACFSATVLPALLLYAGATGSVASGALLLFVFSLGIALPCLALAFGVSRLQPLLTGLHRIGPFLGLATAAVMAGFGVIMVTNRFHLVSGFIGQTLGLW